MNYIDITQPNQTLNIVLDYDFNLEEGLNGDDIDFYVYKDGQGVNVVKNLNGNISVEGDTIEWAGNVDTYSYYQKTNFDEDVLLQLEDEKIYSVVAIASINNKDKVVYRGKFQTTQQPLEDYSVNNSRYNQKTTTNNYTILD